MKYDAQPLFPSLSLSVTPLSQRPAFGSCDQYTLCTANPRHGFGLRDQSII